MSENITVAVAETTPQETTPVTGTPQDEARRALYEKHYGSPGGSEQAPVSDPSQVSVAQTEPSPVVQETPAAVPVPPEYIEALQAIQQELAQLKAGQLPKVAPADAAAAPDWIALLREGRIDEAKAALVNDVAKTVQAPMIDQAVNRAREIARAEADIDIFVRDLRASNQDIIDMEQFVTLDAQSRLGAAQAAGKIKTTEDAVREYKKAVLESTDAARKTAQKLRGSGKNEAMVRSREVLSASTLSPQQITQPVQNQGDGKTAEPESLESYFEKRKASESSRRGLAV